MKLTLVLPCKVGDPNDSGEKEPAAEPPPTILVAARETDDDELEMADSVERIPRPAEVPLRFQVDLNLMPAEGTIN